MQPTLKDFFAIPGNTAHRALADALVLQSLSKHLLDLAFANPKTGSLEAVMDALKTSSGRIGDLSAGLAHQGRCQISPELAH